MDKTIWLAPTLAIYFLYQAVVLEQINNRQAIDHYLREKGVEV